MGLVRNCSQQATSAFPSRAVTSGSDVRVWELADRKQKTRVAAPAGNNSSNVEHKLCIEFLWKLQQLPLDFLHPSPGSWAGVSGSGYIIARASSRRVNSKHAPCAARHRNRMGGGWLARYLPPNTRAWRVPKLAQCSSLRTWPIIWSAVLVSLNCKYVCLRP